MKMNFRRLIGDFLLMLPIGLIGFVYYIFAIVFFYPKTQSHQESFLSFFIFHILLFLLLWSFIQAVICKPGNSPRNWGFYQSDSDTKKKRYCLVCHSFKPERCHHCSTCDTCILGMDHHCPWINNCVGFFNRKIFILLLLYSLINGFFILFKLTGQVYSSLELILSDSIQVSLIPHLYYIAVYFFLLILMIILSRFTYFHIKLVLKNSTTVEMLDKEAENYSISPLWNWRQVFGKNPWLWFLPVYLETGKPIGDGITWARPKAPFELKANSNSDHNQEASGSPYFESPLNISNIVKSSSLNSSVEYSQDLNSMQYVKSDSGASSPFILPRGKA
ncbi:DHHC2_2 [Blepharisma stoltei]|uniref:Palmitoyltransferase n=1 Tax=Blepharisma stoltei TaxID=1481888 RepID=A0AAU9IA84_9CILI|nr:unnamed protein product [Blepharisma stoltei]